MKIGYNRAPEKRIFERDEMELGKPYWAMEDIDDIENKEEERGELIPIEGQSHPTRFFVPMAIVPYPKTEVPIRHSRVMMVFDEQSQIPLVIQYDQVPDEYVKVPVAITVGFRFNDV